MGRSKEASETPSRQRGGCAGEHSVSLSRVPVKPCDSLGQLSPAATSLPTGIQDRAEPGAAPANWSWVVYKGVPPQNCSAAAMGRGDYG